MKEVTDALLREFVLGKLADKERERIEDLFLTDSQTRGSVLAIEQDLIEDYLEDNLTPEDKERFLARYAQTEKQRRKLRIQKSIKDWAITSATVPQATAATASVWSRLSGRLRLKPVFVVPIAAIIVIAIVLGIVWLNSQREKQKHLAIEQELAQLNSPESLREVPSQMILFDLRPVALRSIESPAELSPGGISLVEVHLPWIQKERYSTYQAEVGRVDDDETFSIPNLHAEDDGEYRIRIRLPTHMLRPGSYQIQLRGIANDGTASPAAEYHFIVSG